MKSAETITLDENDKLVRKSQTFWIFFCKYSPEFRDKYGTDFLNTTNISNNPIGNAIYKYENHPSVIAMKNIWKVPIRNFPLSQKRILRNL